MILSRDGRMMNCLASEWNQTILLFILHTYLLLPVLSHRRVGKPRLIEIQVQRSHVFCFSPFPFQLSLQPVSQKTPERSLDQRSVAQSVFFSNQMVIGFHAIY